ncbi:MAG TPA: hypothetical protein VIJ39_02880 [Solirubrobacteraceae bacterium]
MRRLPVSATYTSPVAAATATPLEGSYGEPGTSDISPAPEPLAPNEAVNV